MKSGYLFLFLGIALCILLWVWFAPQEPLPSKPPSQAPRVKFNPKVEIETTSEIDKKMVSGDSSRMLRDPSPRPPSPAPPSPIKPPPALRPSVKPPPPPIEPREENPPLYLKTASDGFSSYSTELPEPSPSDSQIYDLPSVPPPKVRFDPPGEEIHPPVAPSSSSSASSNEFRVTIVNDSLLVSKGLNQKALDNNHRLREPIARAITGIWNEASFGSEGDIYQIRYKMVEPGPKNQFDIYQDTVEAIPKKGQGASGTVTGLFDDGESYFISFADSAVMPAMRLQKDGKFLQAFDKHGNISVIFRR